METRKPPAFRTATAADVPKLVALMESAYRGEASRAGWTTEADLLEGQRTDPQGVAHVIARRTAACSCWSRTASRRLLPARAPGDHAYFGMFAVRPDPAGRRVGRAVLAEAERFAREEWGAREMQMNVIMQS